MSGAMEGLFGRPVTAEASNSGRGKGIGTEPTVDLSTASLVSWLQDVLYEEEQNGWGLRW